MNKQTHATSGRPAALADLEAAYGAPSQAAFGSAVFHERLNAGRSVEEMALEKYKYFVGDLWSRYGETAWIGPWKEVYSRSAGAKAGIVSELHSIKDVDAARSVPMLVDDLEGAEKARAALSAVFDDPAVTELRVFNLGDGEAMSGLLVAGRRAEAGDATCVVLLLD